MSSTGQPAGPGHGVHLPSESVYTERDGAFRIEGLEPAESAEIRATLNAADRLQAGGSRTQRKQVAIEAGRTTRVDFDFQLAAAYLHGQISIGGQAVEWGVVLTETERQILAELPTLRKARVSSVFLALEAKACMTEHGKAIPRLHDELTSSHRTVHGDSVEAIAGGFVMINAADAFVSSDRNKKKIRNGGYAVTAHKQPRAAERVVDAIMKIPRRSKVAGEGFDAIGITMVNCRNDRTEVTIDAAACAKLPPIATYGSLIDRLGRHYAARCATV